MEKTEELLEIVRVRNLCRSGVARSLREGAGLGLREVGRALDIGAATLSRWERGTRAPRGEAALRYVRFLDELIAQGRER